MHIPLRTHGAPIHPGGHSKSRWTGVRHYLPLLLGLPLAACGESPLAPLEEEVVFEAPAQIEAFKPAAGDLRGRVLSSSQDPVWMTQTMANLARLEAALDTRDGTEAELAHSALLSDLASCRAESCLSSPDRSVLEITLEHARRLFSRTPK